MQPQPEILISVVAFGWHGFREVLTHCALLNGNTVSKIIADLDEKFLKLRDDIAQNLAEHIDR